ncbi:MAG: hypothetical protein JXR83_21495 [Deltaproteobacteria bacterium]|nr:hypothetical protein [Deltaproteobacteria bacterium]
MAWNRIDWLYAQRPVPTTEVYLDLVGRELYELCLVFPPAPNEIAFLDDQVRARFEPLLGQMSAPTADLMLAVADLLDWETDHEVERIDEYMRDERYRTVAPSPVAVEAMHLLYRGLFDRLLERKENSARPFPRRDLHRAIASFRRCVRSQV